ENAVLAPAVRAAACLVVAEVIPSGSAGAIVLANRAPLTLADIRAPDFPTGARGLVQASLFIHEMPRLPSDHPTRGRDESPTRRARRCRRTATGRRSRSGGPDHEWLCRAKRIVAKLNGGCRDIDERAA